MVTATVPSDVPRAADGAARPVVLDAAGLTKVYGRAEAALRAVDGVDLVVRAGEVVALLGPNGAGKTTTIKMVAGLVTPTDGSLTILGEDLARRRGAAVRHLGAVLEGGRNVYWALSAWQNLIYFGRLRGLRTKEVAPRAERLLRELGLWDRRREPVGGFSRGMQQKVAIASALVSDPALLLLDEPTIGLDVNAARMVKSWVGQLAAEEGTAVVLTTHQLGVAEKLSHRVVVIDAGRVLADRPVDDLLDEFREDSYEIRVGVPPEAVPASPLYDLGPGDNESASLFVASGDDLYQVLRALGDQHVPLVSVASVRPGLEEVFVRLIGGEQ